MSGDNHHRWIVAWQGGNIFVRQPFGLYYSHNEQPSMDFGMAVCA
jgi:hypothetical protein